MGGKVWRTPHSPALEALLREGETAQVGRENLKTHRWFLGEREGGEEELRLQRHKKTHKPRTVPSPKAA